MSKVFAQHTSNFITESPTKNHHKRKQSGRLIVFLLFCLSIICISALTLLVSFAGAEPGEDVSSHETDAQAVQEQIAVLNAELEAKVEKYNSANYELEQIKGSIEENETKLQETAVVLEDTQERLDKRVANIYKNGSTDILDVLMETTDINDFLTKFDMLTKVGEQDKSDIEQVQLLKAQIEKAQEKLAEDEKTQSDLLGQLEAEKADIEAGLAERQQMLAQIEDEIATIREQEAAAQAQLQAEVTAGLAGSVEAGGGGGGGGGGYSAPPVSTAGGAVGIAMQYLGVPYVWGGASAGGVDCSGLVMVVYGALGYSLPHSAAAQYGYGTPISYNELAPGDLVFFGYGSGISHVGIYIGGGNMIHAPFEGQVVSIAPVQYGGSFAGACRL